MEERSLYLWADDIDNFNRGIDDGTVVGMHRHSIALQTCSSPAIAATKAYRVHRKVHVRSRTR